MPHVVKVLVDDFGEKRDSPKWCYVHEICGGNATLCGGEYFGYGESKVIYKEKEGKITCPKCIALIRKFQAIRL